MGDHELTGVKIQHGHVVRLREHRLLLAVVDSLGPSNRSAASNHLRKVLNS